MKHIHLWLLVLTCLTVCQCTKKDHAADPSLSPAYTDSAIDRLKTLLPREHLTRLNLAAPELIGFDGEQKAIRFFEEGSDQKRFVILYKKEGVFTGTSVDVSGVHENGHKTQGRAVISQLTTGETMTLEVKDDLVVDVRAPDGTAADSRRSPGSGERTAISTPDNPLNLDAFVLQGYTSPNISYYSLYWLFGQSPDFLLCYTPESSYRNGTYTTNFSDMEVIPVVDSPDHPIASIAKELGCFTFSGKSTYTVTINVNQPTPMTRSIVNLRSNHPVGHTYLTLEQVQLNGNSVVRNVGFYPKHKAKMGREVDQSIYGDDSGTPYTVALKISVTSSEFQTIITNLTQQQDTPYDLNNFNCTTSALTVLSSINIRLPATLTSTPVFNGYNPGNLGEDLRNINLKTLSSNNAGRKFVRVSYGKNDALPAEPQGNCN